MDTSTAEITFLGTGTSIGVPVIGCDCAVCSSDDPRNKRLRASIVVRTEESTILVDAGPDLRQQALRDGLTELDAVVFTHAHSDHVMGFDDLRRFTVGEDALLDIYANASTLERLQVAFEYAFNGQNRYYGYLKPKSHLIDGPFEVGGWQITPLPVTHGKVDTIGFLFSKAGERRFAYIPDAKTLSIEAMNHIQGIPLLIIDGLQPMHHYTHLSIPEAIEVAQQSGAKQTWLTHCSCRVDYAQTEADLPDGISLSWDGLKLQC